MTEENNDTPPPVEDVNEVAEQSTSGEEAPPPAFATARAARWDQPSRPGKWTTIGCGLGIVLLVAALFAGSSLLKKTVWAGFAGTGRQLVANLPGNLPPGERMRLTRNLDRFRAQLELRDEPYEAMGEFRRLVREALEDRKVTREEVQEINAFLESELTPDKLDVPYSMP